MWGGKKSGTSSSPGGNPGRGVAAHGMDLSSVIMNLNGIEQRQRELEHKIEEINRRLIQLESPEVATASTTTGESLPEAQLPGDDVALPPAVVEEIRPDIDHDVRAFLLVCDEGRVSLPDAVQWFRAQSERYAVEPVCANQDSWGLLRVAYDDDARVLPVLRTTMLKMSLDEHYDMLRYNNLEPLKVGNVIRVAKEHRENGVWRVVSRGEIHGQV